MDLEEKKEIAYQNKDVTMKSLTDFFRGQSFLIYGADIPEIVEAKPTNLPVIEAKELRLDNLFLLKDGSYAIVDYESDYDEENKQKYLGYVAQVVKKLYVLYRRYFKIRMVVIYSADVNENMTNPILDMTGVKLELTEAFLIEMDSDVIYNEAERNLLLNGCFSDESMMKLIIYPLTYKGKEKKQEAIGRVIDLLERTNDEEQRKFVAKYLWAFTDKVIDAENVERLRRMISMTKIEQLFENEKIEAVKVAVNKAVSETREEDDRKAELNMRKVVERFLRKGNSVEEISECTEVSIDEVKKIAENLLQNA